MNRNEMSQKKLKMIIVAVLSLVALLSNSDVFANAAASTDDTAQQVSLPSTTASPTSAASPSSSTSAASTTTTNKKTTSTKTASMATASESSSGSGESSLGGNLSVAGSDPYTGAMIYSIPIDVPPGRNGMTPKISLTYRNNSPYGWIGEGWNLEMGSVQREARLGINYSGDDYVLQKEGSSQQLVNTGSGYRAKIEQEFIRIQKLTASDGMPYWMATDKTGVQYRFGYTGASRQYDASNTSHIFKWCLDYVIDTNNNFMNLTYTNAQGQIYLSQIYYTGNGSLVPTNHVIFYLGNNGTTSGTITNSYGPKFSVATGKKLVTIDVLNGANRVRSYRLDYTYDQNTNRPVLAKVQQYGKDAQLDSNHLVSSGTSLPPIALGNDTTSKYVCGSNPCSFVSGTPWNSYISGSSQLIGDFNGDGKSDVLQYSYDGSFWYVYTNLSHGDGTFAPWVYSSYQMSGSSAQSALLTGDFNGDGKTDLIFYSIDYNTSLWQGVVALSNGDGTYTTHPLPSTNTGLPTTGDFNGDGKTDLATYSIDENGVLSLSVSFSQGNGTFLWPVVSSFNLNVSGYNIMAGDFDGDGKTDLIFYQNIYGVNGYLFLSNGDGTFAQPVYFSIPNSAGFNFTIGDFNGDGNADLIAFTNDSSGLHGNVILSKGDGTFTQPISFMLPMNVAGYNSTIGDFNGDGMTDILLYSYDGTNLHGYVAHATGDGGFSPLQSFTAAMNLSTFYTTMATTGDFNGDGKTDLLLHDITTKGSVAISGDGTGKLLQSINNGIGGNTLISYSPSTVYNNVQLPFPIQTVGSITNCDNYNSTTKACAGNSAIYTYNYADGFYHIGERDFRGFNYAKTSGPTGPSGEQNVTENWFHQGNDTDLIPENSSVSYLMTLANVANGYTKGKPYRKRVSDAQGNKYSEDTTIYAANTLSPNFFTPPHEVDSYSYDGGASYRQTKTVYAYDGYGNVTEEDQYGDVNVSTDDRTITRTFSPNTTAWIVGLPASENVYQGIGTTTKVAGNTYYYDDLTACNGAQTNNQTPSKGNLTRVVNWLNGGVSPETRIAYDAYGNPVCNRDPNLNVSSITYDSSSSTFPTVVTNPLGRNTTTQYYVGNLSDNGLYGQVQSKTDPNNAVIAMQYDALGRITKETEPDSSWTNWTYNGFGTFGTQNVRADSSLGLWKETYFDGFGRAIKIRSSGPTNPVRTDISYDVRGAVRTTSLPYFDVNGASVYNKTFSYDPVGRKAQLTNPDTTRELYCYSNGVKTTIDANNHGKHETTDPNGHLVKVEEYTGTSTTCSTASLTLYATTLYHYDVIGNLLSVTDAQNNQATMAYDTLGRKTSMHDPDMANWSYTYDSNGNLTSQTDAKSNVVTFDYDSLNRMTNKHYPSGTNVNFTYDETASTNPLGRLTTMADESGTTKYFYDAMGRANKTIRSIGSNNYTLQAAYNGLGKITSITYPDNATINYTYDAGGNHYQVGNGYATYSNYNALGQPGTVTYGNNYSTTFGYNPANNRLGSIAAKYPNGSGLITLAYTYDNKGNIQNITDTPAGARNQAFNYDELNRMTQAQGIPAQGGYGTLSYSYDKIGNLLTKEGVTLSYPMSGANSVRPHGVTFTSSGKSYGYDNNGNMTSAGTRTITYTYDNLPRLINGTVSFVYDGNGNRVQKTSGSGTTTYIDKFYECSPSTSTCSKYIFAGGTRIAQQSSTNTFYFLPDQLGSTVMVDDSQNGAKLEDITYYPYGATLSDTGPTNIHQKFTGQELDGETGLYNYKARLYDPEIGRFVSADSIVSDPTNPQSLNRYSYVQNSPPNFSDPTGHDICDSFTCMGFGLTGEGDGDPWSVGDDGGDNSTNDAVSNYYSWYYHQLSNIESWYMKNWQMISIMKNGGISSGGVSSNLPTGKFNGGTYSSGLTNNSPVANYRNSSIVPGGINATLYAGLGAAGFVQSIGNATVSGGNYINIGQSGVGNGSWLTYGAEKGKVDNITTTGGAGIGEGIVFGFYFGPQSGFIGETTNLTFVLGEYGLTVSINSSGGGASFGAGGKSLGYGYYINTTNTIILR